MEERREGWMNARESEERRERERATDERRLIHELRRERTDVGVRRWASDDGGREREGAERGLGEGTWEVGRETFVSRGGGFRERRERDVHERAVLDAARVDGSDV